MKMLNLFVLIFLALSSSSYAERILSGYPKMDPTFPETLEGLESLQVLSGGTGGVLVLRDPKTAQKYTLKSTSDVDHFKEEILTDALYRALDVDVPDFALYNELPATLDTKGLPLNKKGILRLARFKEPHAKAGDNDKKVLIKSLIKKNFIADAFLSNWDVVEDLKNVVLDKSARLWRVDNGGGLRYRAKGEKKTQGKKWEQESVSELVTMRDANTSKDGAAIYGNLTENECKAQVRHLFKKSPDLFTALNDLDRLLKINGVDELRNNLIGRLQDLQTKYMQELQPGEVYIADPYTPAVAGKTSAGMFIISEQNGEKVVLLGKRVRHNWFGNLGGKSDAGDQFLYKTAAREVYEESMKLIKVTPEELLSSPSHDFITSHGLFRTYFVNHHFIDAKHFNKALKDSSKAEEYTEFKWVSLEKFIDCVMHGSFVKEENAWTAKVDEETILHAPLFDSSRELPALDLLNQINAGKKVARSVTQSKFAGYAVTGPAFLNQAEAPKLRVFWPQPTTIDHMKGARLVRVGDHVRVEKRTRDNHAVKQQITAAIVNKGEVNVALLEEIKAKRAKLDPKASVPAQATSSTSTDKTYTQTEAFLKIVEGDSYDHTRTSAKKINDFLQKQAKFCKDRNPNDTFESTLVKALAAEGEHKDKLVFYHATMPSFAFMYDLYAEFRRQITMQKGENWAALRATDSKFAKFANATDFYNFFKGTSNGAGLNYGSKDGVSYQEMGLSTNPFLFGNDGNSTSASYYLFYSSQSVSPPSVEELFKKFAAEVGLKTDYNRYVDLYNRYYETKYENMTKSLFLDESAKRREDIAKNGRLYQVFIDPKVADKVAYMAKSGGRRIIFTGVPGHKEEYFGTRDLLGLLKTNPYAFRDLLPKAHFCDSSSHPDLDDVQARIYLKPEVMYSDDVKVVSYWRHPLKDKHQATYQSRLHNIVKSDVIEWLKEGVSAGIQTYAGATSTAVNTNESMLSKRKADMSSEVKLTPKKKKRDRKRKTDDLPVASSSSSSTSADFDTTDAHLPKLQRLYKKVVEGVLKEETTLSLSLLPSHVMTGQVEAVDELLEDSNKRVNQLFNHPADSTKRCHLLTLVQEGNTQMAWTLYVHGASLATIDINGIHQDDKRLINKNFISLIKEFHNPAGAKTSLQIDEDQEEVADRLLEEFVSDLSTYGANMYRDDQARSALAYLFTVLFEHKQMDAANGYLASFAMTADQELYRSIVDSLISFALKSKDAGLATWALDQVTDPKDAMTILKVILMHANAHALAFWEKKFGKAIVDQDLKNLLQPDLLVKDKKFTESMFATLLRGGIKSDALYATLFSVCLERNCASDDLLAWVTRYFEGKKGEDTVHLLPIAVTYLRTSIQALTDVVPVRTLIQFAFDRADPKARATYIAGDSLFKDIIAKNFAHSMVGFDELISALLIMDFPVTTKDYADHQVMEDLMANWPTKQSAAQLIMTRIDCGAGYYTDTGVVYPLHQLNQDGALALLAGLAVTCPESYALQHTLLTAMNRQSWLPKAAPKALKVEDTVAYLIQQHKAAELDTLLTTGKFDVKKPLPNRIFDGQKMATRQETMLPVLMARGDLKTLIVLIKHGASLVKVDTYAKLCDEKREEIKRLSPVDFGYLIDSGLPVSKDFISYATLRLLSPEGNAQEIVKTWNALKKCIQIQYGDNHDYMSSFLKESLVTIEKKDIPVLRNEIHQIVASIHSGFDKETSKDTIFDAIKVNNLLAFEKEIKLPSVRSTLKDKVPTFLDLAAKHEAYAIIDKLMPSVNSDRFATQLLDAVIANAALNTFQKYFNDTKYTFKSHVAVDKVMPKLAEALSNKKISQDQFDTFSAYLKANFSK